MFVTVKRCVRAGADGVASAHPDGASGAAPASVLFRATDGKSTGRTKISTVVCAWNSRPGGAGSHAGLP